MKAIEFQSVTLELGGRLVLSDVDFEIESGEFIGLLGPNGAGKTTLMRAALGLISPRSGTIKVEGRTASPEVAAVGYMPQTRVTPDLRWTGWDFLASAVGGRRWGLPILNTADRGELSQILDLVGVRELARRPLGELSGGERQRLLICQALLGRPSVLLLDEPLASLDPKHQRATVDLTRRLQRELNVTIVFSAHELNPLLSSIDRVLYVGNKRAVLGAVQDVVTGPVLSRLYDAQIEVIKVGERIFVVAGDSELDPAAHACGVRANGFHLETSHSGSRSHAGL